MSGPQPALFGQQLPPPADRRRTVLELGQPVLHGAYRIGIVEVHGRHAGAHVSQSRAGWWVIRWPPDRAQKCRSLVRRLARFGPTALSGKTPES